MAPVTALPARYAKFIAAVLGEAVAYVQLYGTTWHLDAALVMAGAALAVLGVPNAAGPVPGMTVNVTSTDPAQVGQQVAAAIRASTRSAAPIAGIRPPDPPSGTVTPEVSTPPPGNVTVQRPTGGITP